MIIYSSFPFLKHVGLTWRRNFHIWKHNFVWYIQQIIFDKNLKEEKRINYINSYYIRIYAQEHNINYTILS